VIAPYRVPSRFATNSATMVGSAITLQSPRVCTSGLSNAPWEELTERRTSSTGTPRVSGRPRQTRAKDENLRAQPLGGPLSASSGNSGIVTVCLVFSVGITITPSRIRPNMAASPRRTSPCGERSNISQPRAGRVRPWTSSAPRRSCPRSCRP
jgi:hypothetical protein